MANRDYDAKKYLCAPWLGQRGQPWVKDFKPAFENALKQKSDHFSTYYQCLFGMDFGGWGAGAPAHIMGAGALAGQNALSQQAILSRRDAILCSTMLFHAKSEFAMLRSCTICFAICWTHERPVHQILQNICCSYLPDCTIVID